MPLFDAEDLDDLSDALGQTQFTMGSTTVSGFFSAIGGEVLSNGEGEQVATRLIGRVHRGALPDLDVDAEITVADAPDPDHDGDYVVRTVPIAVQGGYYVEFELQQAAA